MSDDSLPPEKIAFIGYNIGVYESVQKFGSLISSGKITGDQDPSKVAELLAESSAFYDADMMAALINATLSHHSGKKIIERVTRDQVRNVLDQLKAAGVTLP
jgi:hypothetical protein